MILKANLYLVGMVGVLMVTDSWIHKHHEKCQAEFKKLGDVELKGGD